MRILIFLYLITAALSLQAQTETGYYKLSKLKAEKSSKEEKTRIQFRFEGPDGQPAKSHVKFTMNTDTIIPAIDAQGTFDIYAKPGKYKFLFTTPGWYAVGTDSIQLKKDHPLSLFIHFEAREIPLNGLKK